MQITFGQLNFTLKDDKILLTNCGSLSFPDGNTFVEVQISGENKPTHMGAKMASSAEGATLRYRSHEQTDDTLTIVQDNERIQATTVFTRYADTNAVRIYTQVQNVGDSDIVLEEVSAFTALGLGKKGLSSAEDLYFTRFLQTHHGECQPRRQSFVDAGLYVAKAEGQRRLAFANVGSWSTKEELPQGILEDVSTGDFTMFQIESNASWYYEIADYRAYYYLYLSGANLPFGGWSKKLSKGESYRTVSVALAFGKSANEVIAQMTAYRRHIAGKNALDSVMPVIFNEYMHLSWDSPTEENTRKVAPVAAQLGMDYYVIDCGWHNEEDGNIIYPYVGQWKESKARFPHGVRAITDYIRSLGMKAGLWIEPEIIGVKCEEMLAFYDDDCFLQRNGKRLAVMNRHFLDYRNPKVRAYMSETIRRMVEDYGADYIKFDYNQDCGVGTDYLSFCAAEGLEACADAFLEWAKEMIARYPQTVFEACASGGMRMDYKTLSAFSLVSTSDQTDYIKYPYIAGNVLSAVIPEQAAVWSYPVESLGAFEKPFDSTAEWVEKHIDEHRIVVNMINSFLGRMHLASHIELLSKAQLALVKEGIDYYRSLVAAKKTGTPYFPLGFTRFGEDCVAAGFKSGNVIYLAVWCLKGDTAVYIPIKEGVKAVRCAYPSSFSPALIKTGDGIKVEFAQTATAAFLEIEV